MLPDHRPDRWPDFSPSDSPLDPGARDSAPAPFSTASFTLALFVLGVTIGLLALLGRFAQELEVSLLTDLHAGLWTTPASRTRLPAMIHGLSTSGQHWVAAGFAASVSSITLSAALWWLGGGRTPPRAITPAPLNLLVGLITFALLAGMACALVCPDPTIRLAVLISAFIVAALLFVIFVAWIVRSTLRRN